MDLRLSADKTQLLAGYIPGYFQYLCGGEGVTMRNCRRHVFFAIGTMVLCGASCLVPRAGAQSAAGSLPAQPVPQSPSPQDCGSTARKLGCPINNSVHFQRFFNAVFSWETLVGPPASVAFSQTLTSHAGYSSNGDGYVYHYAVNLTNNVEGKFFARYAAPAIFRQDDAYHPLGPEHSTGARVGHIFAHIFVTRSADDSHQVFNASGIPSAIVTTLINNPQEPPEQRTVGKNFEGLAWKIGIFAADDAWTEYKGAIMRLVPGHKREASAAGTP